jgi:hypothetical protein
VHLRIESFNATMAKPFRWTMKGKRWWHEMAKRVGISGKTYYLGNERQKRRPRQA